jgi:hypothetical protein
MALGDPAFCVRCYAAEALGWIGPAAAPAVLKLIELARSDLSRQAKRSATWALGQIGDARAVPVLVAALDDGDLRVTAAYALGHIGPPAAPAVPTLAARLTDDSEFVRQAAAQALFLIGLASEPTIAALERALKDPDDNVRDTAELALKKLKAL